MFNKNNEKPENDISTYCLICNISHNDQNFSIPCSCNICKSCFLEWIYTENKENEYIPNSKFSCPNYLCKKKFSYESIINLLNREEKEKINDILLRKFMNNNPETRKCPKKNCSYGGWIDISENSKCTEKLKCLCCDSEWIEESILKYNFNDYFFFFLNFKNLKNIFLNYFSQINIRFTSKPCFKCGIPIYKYDGCSHMKCPKCEQKFCYICNKEHITNEDENICYMKNILNNFFLFLVFFLIFLKILLSLNFLNFIFEKLFYFIIMNILFGIYMNILYFGFLFLYYGFHPQSFEHLGLLNNKKLGKFIGICTLCIFASHLYLYFESDFVRYFTLVLFKEISSVIIISLCILYYLLIFQK